MRNAFCTSNLRLAILLFLAVGLLPKPGVRRRARRGSQLTLPTDPEGPPAPNPPFDLFASTRFNYPYTRRENITDQRVNIAWRAVILENEYRECSVLPDLGGHLPAPLVESCWPDQRRGRLEREFPEIREDVCAPNPERYEETLSREYAARSRAFFTLRERAESSPDSRPPGLRTSN